MLAAFRNALSRFRLNATSSGKKRMPTAFTVSIALHALVLAINFGIPEEGMKIVREKALDIVLVNSRSAFKPAKAQVLAQSNLDSGGNVEEDRRASTPLPSMAVDRPANQALERAQQRVKQLEFKQDQLATQVGLNRRVRPDAQQNPKIEPVTSPTGVDQTKTAKLMARMESEIARSLEEYSKLPRKKSIGTRAEEYRFARYIEDWRTKVERIGTLNYPEAAKGKLFGSLVLTVALKSDGSIYRVEITRSSGHTILDEAAIRIVRMAAPYATFPPDIERDTDILEITRTWSFTSNNELQSF